MCDPFLQGLAGELGVLWVEATHQIIRDPTSQRLRTSPRPSWTSPIGCAPRMRGPPETPPRVRTVRRRGETRSEGTCPVFGHQRDQVGIEHRSPARARADDARLPDGLESDHRTAVTAANIAAVVTVGASSSGG